MCMETCYVVYSFNSETRLSRCLQNLISTPRGLSDRHRWRRRLAASFLSAALRSRFSPSPHNRRRICRTNKRYANFHMTPQSVCPHAARTTQKPAAASYIQRIKMCFRYSIKYKIVLLSRDNGMGTQDTAVQIRLDRIICHTMI